MKFWTKLVTVLGIAALLLATPAVAAKKKALPPGYAPNGCTWSPDRGVFPTYYNFKQACNRHDYCYDQLWYGGGETGRLRCDRYFRDEMRSWCSKEYRSIGRQKSRYKCYGVAEVYYRAVRRFGKSYFDNPAKN